MELLTIPKITTVPYIGFLIIRILFLFWVYIWALMFWNFHVICLPA